MEDVDEGRELEAATLSSITERKSDCCSVDSAVEDELAWPLDILAMVDATSFQWLVVMLHHFRNPAF